MSKVRGKGIKYIPVVEVEDGHTYEMEPDRDAYVELERQMLKLREVSAKTRKPEYANMVKKELAQLREERKETACSEIVNLELTLGKNKKVVELMGKRPSLKELKAHFTDFRKSLSSGRAEKRTIRPERKTYMGMQYNQSGGVFTESGSIVNLMGRKDRNARIRNHKAPHPKIQHNYFGLELELISAANKDELEALFVAEKLDSNIHIRGDGSITGAKPGFHPNEVTVLVKEADLEDVITRVCKVLKATKTYVNNTCGGHVHVDVRRRSPTAVYSNMRNVLPLMSKLVTVDRVQNDRYCSTNIEKDFNTASQSSGRYKAVNATSYAKYKTIEVRYGNASVDANDLIYWCKFLSFVADSKTISDSVSSPDQLIFTDKKLEQWVKDRVELMDDEEYTTEALHKARA